MDLVSLYKKATEQTGKFIDGIGDDQWDKRSDCPEWTVRELVNHIVSENLWMPDLLAGKTVAEVGDKYEGDVLGEDPKGGYHEAIEAANKALSDPGVLEQTVHVSFGDIPGSMYAGQMLLDCVVHGWDIAKSTDQPDELDPELVKTVSEMIKPQLKDIQASGVFGTPVDAPEDAPLQTQLLGWLGRKR